MKSTYESPFETRYGSPKMRKIFSPKYKYGTWRRLWVALAKGEQSLGLDISDAQIRDMEDHIPHVPYGMVVDIERITHHDVVAHLKAYANQCLGAAPIIHLGATSAYIVDNADAIVMRKAAGVLLSKLQMVLDTMFLMAYRYKNSPTLAYTHFQPAQPTTFGKRVCMWVQDLEDDKARLKREIEDGVRILGCKGTTGTCASFMELFDGDYEKVCKLDEFISNYVGIKSVDISGQTYSRKRDYYLFSVLSGIAQSLSKMANDMRLMSGHGEFNEPYGDGQVGSSAMAYKQNPIMCEKVVSLARLVINNTTTLADTAANQWLERSLDDSAARRVLIPETFLALDEMLITMAKILVGCRVNTSIMLQGVKREIPKLVSEGILMTAVKKGGNRQELHEAIRKYTVYDLGNFTMAVLRDPRFNINLEELQVLMDIDTLVGAAPMQVDDYLSKISKEDQHGKT